MKLKQKNAAGKRVIWDGELWEVLDHISLHEDEDFLVLRQKSKTTAHEDGTPINDIAVIDCHNDTFVFYAPKYAKFLDKNQRNMKVKDVDDLQGELDDVWLDQFIGDDE